MSAIGVFDSGLGGLSITKSIRQHLSELPLIYIADSVHAPYGNKSQGFILQRARELTQHLVSRGCSLIVVACNTATVNTINQLRQEFDVDFVGVEPGIKPAFEASKTKVIAVLATQRTVDSHRFQQFTQSFEHRGKCLLQPCPGLMEQVEKLQLDTTETHSMLEFYITPLLGQGADTLVLGCTHYPFLQDSIQQLFGEKLQIINTSDAVARQVKRLHKSPEASTATANEQFFTSGDIEVASQRISYLWGQQVSCQPFKTSV